MSVNIIELLSHHQGISSLPKIDPNTQDVEETQKHDSNRLLQAAIPAILAGFYQFSRNDDDAQIIAQQKEDSDWIGLLYGKEKQVLIEKIAEYASVPAQVAETKMEAIALDALRLLRINASPATGAGIKSLLTNERHNILNHLPGAIGIGNILNDSTLDDRTNKMEGPVSSFMHAIEKQFASTNIAETKKAESGK